MTTGETTWPELQAWRQLGGGGQSEDGAPCDSMLAWCPPCDNFHYHGGPRIGDPDDGPGHKVAHCLDLNRYPRGYVIVSSGWYPDDIRHGTRARWRAGCRCDSCKLKGGRRYGTLS